MTMTIVRSLATIVLIVAVAPIANSLTIVAVAPIVAPIGIVTSLRSVPILVAPPTSPWPNDIASEWA